MVWTVQRNGPMARSLTVLGIALVACAACAAPSIEVNEDPIGVPSRAQGSGDDARQDRSSSDTTGASQSTSSPGPAPSSTATADPTPSSPPASPPPPVGKWMQANGQECTAFCAAAGKTNVVSSDGAKCTSGENIPASAIAGGITYDKCFPSCNAHTSGQTPVSEGKNCYAQGQKHDGDSSDATRGCFCK